MSAHGQFVPGRSRTRIPHVARAAIVPGKARFLHSSMNACFFESLESGGLGMGQPRIDTTLRKSPAPAAGSNQEKLDALAAHAIANSGNLSAAAKGLSLRQSKQPGGWLTAS